jgi:hypothetical protein
MAAHPVSDEPETSGADEPGAIAPEERAERIAAARARDETAAALEDAQLPSPAELEAMPDDQLLGFLPAELRDAIAAGEISSEVALAKVREAAGALEPEPADEPDPTSEALAKAHAGYLKEIAAILGEDADIRPCAACSGLGFNPVELPPDHFHERCPDCDGWGNVLSGSRVESQRVLPCNGCNGSGHRPTLQPAERPQTPASVVPVLPTFVPQPPPMEPAGVPPVGVVG